LVFERPNAKQIKCLKKYVNTKITAGIWHFITALHVMQTLYCDENSVCPSVRLSVRPSRA